MKEEAIRKAVEQFRHYTLEEAGNDEPGNWRKGTRDNAKKWEAWDALVAYGDEGREGLASLMMDDNPMVRFEAAIFLVAYAEERALTVLHNYLQMTGKLSVCMGLKQLGAAMTLKR